MKQTNKPLYAVHNQRIAGYLLQRGFPLIRLVYGENYNSFLFVDSLDLHQAIEERSKQIAEMKEKFNLTETR